MRVTARARDAAPARRGSRALLGLDAREGPGRHASRTPASGSPRAARRAGTAARADRPKAPGAVAAPTRTDASAWRRPRARGPTISFVPGAKTCTAARDLVPRRGSLSLMAAMTAGAAAATPGIVHDRVAVAARVGPRRRAGTPAKAPITASAVRFQRAASGPSAGGGTARSASVKGLAATFSSFSKRTQRTIDAHGRAAVGGAAAQRLRQEPRGVLGPRLGGSERLRLRGPITARTSRTSASAFRRSRP
mgnify:CR=1 FL=1